jgi:hypothetical protein
MIDKCTIDRDELQPFNVTLREQQPVEGVAGGRLGIDCVEDVSDFYIEDLQAN